MYEMIYNLKLPLRSFIMGIFSLLLMSVLTGCQSEGVKPVGGDPVATEAVQISQVEPGAAPASTLPASTNKEPETTKANQPQPEDIEAAWRSSAHASSFITDEAGNNNSCARCHAPVNWQPAMADLPESCFACKFELKDPPPYIAEDIWEDIPCQVCHTVDKKKNIQPEVAWLEIAPLGEYARVASTTELCLKCHATADVPDHGVLELGGAHAGYECTGCHSAHSTTTSCDGAGCHANVVEPAAPLPGHDQDHRQVACVACHDASGMDVGLDKEIGVWTTLTGSSRGPLAFTSHNISLEARCDRCHFENNPWSLSVQAAQP